MILMIACLMILTWINRPILISCCCLLFTILKAEDVQGLRLDDLFVPKSEPKAAPIEVQAPRYINGGAPFLIPDFERFTLKEAGLTPLSKDAEKFLSQVDQDKLSTLTAKKNTVAASPNSGTWKKIHSAEIKLPANTARIKFINNLPTAEAEIVVQKKKTPTTPATLLLAAGESENMDLALQEIELEITVWFTDQPAELFVLKKGPFTLEESAYSFTLEAAFEPELLRN